MTAALFRLFRSNIAVSNGSDISTKYSNITSRLNKDFWDLESDLTHRRQVGSYGRQTAIHGISDLDMIFELPWEMYEQYRKYENNGPSQLLQAVRQSLLTRYPKTKIKGDGQVVVLPFGQFVVEVLPAFVDKEADGYRFPDSNDGGSWPVCKPVQEMTAVDERNVRTSRNYKHVCKMLRAWKNTQGVNMGGLLLDTLVYNFFSQNLSYDKATYSDYDELMVSVFSYIGNLEHQDYWAAPGSGQRVHSSGKFQSKAKKAAGKCVEAKDADTEAKKAKFYREIFGRSFPSTSVTAAKSEAAESRQFTTEEFIEDKYPLDIRFNLEIDSHVVGGTAGPSFLRSLSRTFPWLPTGRKLEFFVESCDVPEPYDLYWKVRNVGPVAEQRGIRGQITPDGGRQNKNETTNFRGDHYVEAYVIKDDVCVARDKLDVPIGD
jgi:hypothetical protein